MGASIRTIADTINALQVLQAIDQSSADWTESQSADFHSSSMSPNSHVFLSSPARRRRHEVQKHMSSSDDLPRLFGVKAKDLIMGKLACPAFVQGQHEKGESRALAHRVEVKARPSAASGEPNKILGSRQNV